MSTTCDIIGLNEVEKKRGLISFDAKPGQHETEFTIKEPVKKIGPKETLIHDRGRKHKEKGKLF